MKINKAKRVLSGLLVSVIGMSMLTGCAGLEEKTTEKEEQTFDIKKVVKGLDDGGYYVVHNNVPKKIYFGNATYDEGTESEDDIDPDAETERAMWYTDDYKKIPTMYDGDILIYYSTEELAEQFHFERYEDLGKTVGVCGLKKTESGRYKFEVSEDSQFVYPGHDTSGLLNFPQDSVILDEIGGKPIREDNVSRCGSIYGLPADKTFKCKVYGGTEVKNMNFKADVHTFASYQSYTSTNYTFLSTNIIQVNIPKWFNTGYYCLDGNGMFRYVIGNKYDNKTDFNVLNNNPEKDGENGNAAEQKNESFFVASNETGAKTLTAVLGAAPEGSTPTTATMTVTNPNGKEYTANEGADGSIVLNYDASVVGEYTVSISNLGGRTYTLSGNVDNPDAQQSDVDADDEAGTDEGSSQPES